MGHLQKTALFIWIIPLSLLPGGFVTYILLFQPVPFEYSMLIPFGITALGICSLIFQNKTRVFYQVMVNNDLPQIDAVLWFLNVAFGLSYIGIAVYISYLFYEFAPKKDYIIWLLISLPLIISGSWILLEAFYLQKLIKIHRYANRNSEIQDIKGIKK